MTHAFAPVAAAGQNDGVSYLDLSNATCALCGAGVHFDNHEGRVACNGCGMATDNCTCTGEDLQERAGRNRASGGGAASSA